ncbi:white collar 1 [Fusarium acutatum]|uniref:White collar 1 n=1 Tax=Fusarium acutatum TaxID=78861 RepID=A0A8H4NJ38_9HYPO|nr:white collar 1 [Fusarium acutatum]
MPRTLIYRVTPELDYAIEEVWSIIFKFDAVAAWSPMVVQCTTEGEGIGAVRSAVTDSGAHFNEKLEIFDHEARTISYSFEEPVPFPATIQAMRDALNQIRCLFDIESMMVIWLKPPIKDANTGPHSSNRAPAARKRVSNKWVSEFDSRHGTIQLRVWKQMAWAFKDKEIQPFRDTITAYKVSLDMALSAMTFSTIASLNERTKRFKRAFKEEFKDIKSRLQALDNHRIELGSVAGCKGSEWYGTEADFAMKRFLEYTESLPDSPPASFPGSPIQYLSEDGDELDTRQALPDTRSSRHLNDINSTVSLPGRKYVGLFSDTDPPQIIIYPFNPDLPTDEERMPEWMEDLLLGPIDTDSAPESGSPSNNQIGSKAPDPTTNQDIDGEKLSTNNILSSKVCPWPMHHKAKAQISTTSADLTTPGSKDIYITSAFDAVKVLFLVVNQDNPQFDIGQIDMTCSFVICDVALEDYPIVYASDSFQTLAGYSRHEVLGRNCRFLQSPDGKVERSSPRLFVDNGTAYSLKKSVQEGRETQISMINYRNGGQPFLNHLSIIPIPWDTDEIRD